MDDGWKQVWAAMTDGVLEERLFTYLWLSLHTPNKDAGRIAQLIQEAERRGQPEMVERARMKAATTPEAKWAFRRSRTLFRDEAERHSGIGPNTLRSEATLAF